MPCNQDRTTQLEVEGANVETMASALRVLGFDAVVQGQTIALKKDGVAGLWRNGQLRMNGSVNVAANDVRRAYSRESIVQTAKRQGWALRFQQTGEIVATRRSFS